MDIGKFQVGLTGATAGQSLEVLKLAADTYEKNKEQELENLKNTGLTTRLTARMTLESGEAEASMIQSEATQNFVSAGVGAVSIGGSLYAMRSGSSEMNEEQKNVETAEQYEGAINEVLDNPSERQVEIREAQEEPAELDIEAISAKIDEVEANNRVNTLKKSDFKDPTKLAVDKDTMRMMSDEELRDLLGRVREMKKLANEKMTRLSQDRNMKFNMVNQFAQPVKDTVTGIIKMAWTAPKRSEKADFDKNLAYAGQTLKQIETALGNLTSFKRNQQEQVQGVLAAEKGIAQASAA